MGQNVTVSGNITKDPEYRVTQGGLEVANFSIPAKCGFGKNETTTWYNCVAFGKVAKTMGERIKKGAIIEVTGQIKTDKWTDNDGNQRYSWELIVRDMHVLSWGSPPDERPTEPNNNSYSPSASKPDNDVPF